MEFLLGIIVLIWLISLSGRISKLERRLGEGTKPAAPTQHIEQDHPYTPLDHEKLQPAPAKAKKPTATKKAPEAPPKPQKSFEEQVGGHLFQWLGIGALIIALVVFLKWSFDSGLIGETGRTVFGYLFAAGALAAGDLLRKKYGTWALAFSGGGAFAAYIVTWVAMNKYQMFGTHVGFTIFVLTALLVCLLSMRYNARSLAAFGILGGFITPLLADTNGTAIDLLSYIVILDIAVLALGHVRQWRILNTLAFMGTVAYEILAFNAGEDFTSTFALTFACIFTAIYLFVPAVYNILQKKESDVGDIAILIGNGIAHFGIILWWLDDISPETREFYDVFVAIAFSMLFLVWSMALYKRNKSDTPLVLGGLSLTILFASIAVPMQLGAEWTSVAWSVEAAFLLWMSLTLKDSRIYNFAWPVMAAAYVWYFINPLGGKAVIFLPIGFYIFLLWAALFVGIAILGLSASKEDRHSIQLLPFAFVGAIALTAAVGYSMMMPSQYMPGIGYYEYLTGIERFIQAAVLIGGSYVVLLKAQSRWTDLSDQEKTTFTWLGVAVQIVTLFYLSYEFAQAVRKDYIFADAARPRQIIQVGYSILWAVYASVTLGAGIAKGWKSIRIFSLILLLISIAKLTLFDFASLGTAARVIGFTVLGGLLVAASFVYQHYKDHMKSFFTDSDSPSS